jgi:hypothetical protein
MAYISPAVTVNGFKKCCVSNAMDRTDYNVLCNDSKEDGNVRSVTKMKALTDDGVSDTDW